jgi:predicted SPOUT superfamily RNA methylase MTH1
MPEEMTKKRAMEDLREGKSPSTAAGEFVHEEIEHIREGKHGARSPQQAIAIGLSKARRAGVPLPPPKKGTVSEKTRESAEREYEKGQSGDTKPHSARASRARERALEKEPRSSASHRALSAHAKSAARKRSGESRHDAAMKAVETKGRTGMRQVAKKAARTRAKHSA